jgi:hypothetical protein
MFVTTEITIDFQRPRQNTIQVVQDDTTRKIRLVLKNGGNDYDITSDLESGETWVGAVAYLKSDGHGGVYDTTEDGDAAVQLVSGTTNQFDVLLVGQVFTAAGWTQINIKFYNADFSKVLSTFAIDVNVQRNAASDYESEDYSNMQSLGAIRTEITEFEATVRAELEAMKANGEQDVTDAYIAATQETPGLACEQFFMTLPNGRYRIVINTPAYIYKAEVVTVDEGQYCKVDAYDHDGYCETTIYRNGTAVFNYVDGSTTGRIITTPVQVPTPVNPTDAATKQYVDTKGGLSQTAKQALLNCLAHVAWTDEHGQDYYDALEVALYPPTDLMSISAVFEQGQTVVYDTDSLDVLKSMLTVTAHYSDSTTETVTAYTLSGTLSEGTSTITVSYGGKTTTFNVAVTHKLSLDDIAYGSMTYRDIFVTNNLWYMSDFEGNITLSNDWANYEGDSSKNYKINAGTPVISQEVYNSSTHSLKAFGSGSSQIIVSRLGISMPAGKYLTCAAVNCSRYSAGKLGIQWGSPVNNTVDRLTVAKEGTTDGFEAVAGIMTLTGNHTDFYSYVGSMSSANLDGYVDDVVITPLPSGMTLEQGLALYENYLAIRRDS